MQRPDISVIIPCYKVEAYLERCASSVLNQTLYNIQVILVDDGSPDNVPHMCDMFAVADSRVTVIHKPNGGLGEARNSGLDVAIGEYVIFVDGDDYLELNMLEVLFSQAKNNDYDIVYGGVYCETSEGQFELMNIFDDEFIGRDQIARALGDIVGSNPEDIHANYRYGTAWSGIFRRSLIEDNGIRFRSEREILCEDYVFDAELYVYANSIKYVGVPLYRYCYNTSSLSRSFNPSKLDSLERYCNYMESTIFYRDLDFQCRVMKGYMNLSFSFYSMAINSDLSLKTKYSICKRISKAERLYKISRSYPLNKLPLKWRSVFVCLRRNLFVPLYLKNRIFG